MKYWIIVCAYFISFSFILGLLLTKISIYWSNKFNFIDKPGKRKIHDRNVPLLGGVAIYLTVIGCIIFHILMIYYFTPLIIKMLPQNIVSVLPGIYKVIQKMVVWFIVGTIIFLVGLWDDKKSLHAGVKFIIQSIAAIFLIYKGIRITLFIDNVWVSYVISYLWIVGITNAFNLLDNMDGLSGGVALIASIFLLTISISMNEYFISSFLAVFVGSIGAFLCFNFHPAKIFMGDSGSMFIGFMLSTITIFGTYYYIDNDTLFSVAMPVFVLAVPIYDVFSVSFIRLKEKRPIYKGDNSHFSHRLVNLGMSHKGAVLFIYLACFITGSFALLLSSVNLSGVILLCLQCLSILSIIALLESYGRK